MKQLPAFFDYFIKYPKITLLFAITGLLFGVLSLFSIPKESAPSISFGVVNIQTVVSGASAEDMDNKVAKEIESEIKSIGGIRHYESTSRNSVSVTTIQFEVGEDMTKRMGEVRSKVDQATTKLPKERQDDPLITEIDSSQNQALFSIVLSGDMEPRILQQHAEDIEDVLAKVQGISSTSIDGGKKTEIHVTVRPGTLEQFDLTMQDVTNAITAANSSIPLGGITLDNKNYEMRINGEKESVEDIANIVVANKAKNGNSSLILVKDVAEVIEAAEDTDSLFRFTDVAASTSLQNAVQINLYRKGGADIFAIAERAREAFDGIDLPPELTATILNDSTEIMRQDYRTVALSGVQSFVIVMFFIFLLVGVFEGFAASIIIPLSFLITIGFLYFFGKTLNFMTNFSMILSLGILVDVAIVIVEGVHAYMRQGFSPREAARKSLQEFMMPLFAGTLTTIVVFIPLFTLPGILGEFMSFIPITVTLVLSVALVLAFTVIPSFSSSIMAKKREPGAFRRGIEAWVERLVEKYGRGLGKLISKIRRIIFALLLVMLTFVGSFYIFFTYIPYDMFPTGDAPQLDIALEMPEGTTGEETMRVLGPITNHLESYPEVAYIKINVDGKEGNLNIELLKKEERDAQNLRMGKEVLYALQKDIGQFDLGGGVLQVKIQENGPPTAADVVYRTTVDDPLKIGMAKQITVELTEEMKSIDGTTGVKNNIDELSTLFVFDIFDLKIATLDLPRTLIGMTIRGVLEGQQAGSITTADGDERDIVVLYPEQQIKTTTDLQDIPLVYLPSGTVRIGDVVELQEESALGVIRRFDGDIAFSILAFLKEGQDSKTVEKLFTEKIDAIDLPAEISVKNGGENAEQADLMNALKVGFAMAIALIFVILVMVFHEYIQPLFILVTIIFAQIGVNMGLWVTGTSAGIPYMIGQIALTGVVVNDAIIMIDQMNKKKETLKDVVEAAKSRFVPVALTTLTTSAGILPLAFTDAFWAGLSYTIIFGLFVASSMTLFLTPALFVLSQKHLRQSIAKGQER